MLYHANIFFDKYYIMQILVPGFSIMPFAKAIGLDMG